MRFSDRRLGARLGWLALGLLYLFSFPLANSYLGVNFSDITTGFGSVANFLGRAIPPEIDGIEVLLRLLLETLAMAVIGTFVGVLLAIGLALVATGGGQRAAGAWRPVAWLARGIVVVSRAVPDVVFALLAVQLLGFGPLAGAIALSIGTVGLLGRTLADAMDALPAAADEALSAAGASRIQVAFSSTLPG